MRFVPSRNKLVALVWLAFVLRGVYYCVELPMWEGLDEWAHFAALQYFAEHARMPARADLVSDEVVRSLELAPLPWSNNGWVAGAVNHDEFWRLPPEERSRRGRELARLTAAYRRPADLPPSIQRQYEGQQPPLYYAVLAFPYLATRTWPIEAQVIAMRILSLLLASAAIPLAYGIARATAAARPSAIGVVAFLAAMPAVVMVAAHVGNDSLALVLITLALWALARNRNPWIAGLALGAAMLTKGYAIVLVPVFATRRAAPSLGIALAIAGWWYVGNLATNGTLAGDQMDVAAHAHVSDKLAAITQINWRRVIDSAATTHIWIGGWSFLQLRSWMYRVFEALAFLAALGLMRLCRRPPGLRLSANLAILIVTQLLFLLAMAYFSLNAFVAMHISAGVGWYLVAIAAAEATLLAAGFAGILGLHRARAAMATTVLLALALDLYSMYFLLLPCYHGLIRHRPNGALEAFHPTGLAYIPALWPLHLAAAILTLWSFRNLLAAPAPRPSHRSAAH